MSEIAIKASNTSVSVKEYRGRRVVTLKDIDNVHKRPDGTASRNFKANRKHFIEGEDYFKVTPVDFQKDEIRLSGINNRGTFLLTESGYLMLAKSLTDNLAREVQRQLVGAYFRAKGEESTTDITMIAAQVSQLTVLVHALLERHGATTISAYGSHTPALLEKLVNLLEARQVPVVALPESAQPDNTPDSPPVMCIREQLRHKKLLTKKEAAFYIGISEKTLQNIIEKQGFPPLTRIGFGRGRVFINREMLDAWIDEQAEQ